MRRTGAIKLLAGGALFAAFFLAVMERGDFLGIGGGVFAMIGIGAPGALALVGAIELAFDVPFLMLSKKWDALSGLQRGLLGTAIVIAAAVLIFGPLLLVGWLTHPET